MGNVDFAEWEQKMKKGGVRQGTVRTGRNPQGICRSRGDREKKSAPKRRAPGKGETAYEPALSWRWVTRTASRPRSFSTASVSEAVVWRPMVMV